MPKWQSHDEFKENASEDMKGFARLFDWQQEHPDERRLVVRVLEFTFIVQSVVDLQHMCDTLREAGVPGAEQNLFEVQPEEAIEV